MSDALELTLSVRLAEGLPDGELAELRWHLGLGEQPEHLVLVTAFPEVEEDDDGGLIAENRPRPLLDSTGDLAALPGDGWTLTAHRTVHPAEFEPLGRLLVALAERTGITGPVVIGQLRSPRSTLAEPLLVRGGTVGWPV
ncbi:hypothetical protein [Kitasatospora cinereorecta]|uniref:Uncharacterized protein n=1 Tax=Kitasatospora cinereorecta TaxID=285560 RepID=A0ABW0VGF9_9ACTN